MALRHAGFRRARSYLSGGKILEQPYAVKIEVYACPAMTKPRPTKKPKRSGYHHGDLRHALLEAGLHLVQEQGIEAVTLREVARRAGVSHAAPYHHFPDKAALIEALAIQGFNTFTRTLRETWSAAPGTPLDRLGALGGTYVRFALEHQAEFRLMNRPELRQTTDAGEPSPVSGAALEAYHVLRDAVQACQVAGLVPEGDPEPWALTAWASVHGLAVLQIEGLLQGRVESVEEGMQLAQVVTRTLGHGLMVR